MGRGSWKAGFSGAVDPTWGVSGSPVLPVAQAPTSAVPMKEEEGPWSLVTQPWEAQCSCTPAVKAVTEPSRVQAEGTQSYCPPPASTPSPSLQREGEKSVRPCFETPTTVAFTEHMCQRTSENCMGAESSNPHTGLGNNSIPQLPGENTDEHRRQLTCQSHSSSKR